MRSPSGKTAVTVLATCSFDCSGLIRQFVGHVDRTSTREYPFPSTWYSNAFRIAADASLMRFVSYSACRVTYAGASGYQYEAAAVMDCLRAGQTESDVMPLDESLAIMEVMDELRAQWGLAYPGE